MIVQGLAYNMEGASHIHLRLYIASARQDSDDGIKDSDDELSDRMLHPQKYVTVLEISSFAGSNYGTT